MKEKRDIMKHYIMLALLAGFVLLGCGGCGGDNSQDTNPSDSNNTDNTQIPTPSGPNNSKLHILGPKQGEKLTMYHAYLVFQVIDMITYARLSVPNARRDYLANSLIQNTGTIPCLRNGEQNGTRTLNYSHKDIDDDNYESDSSAGYNMCGDDSFNKYELNGKEYVRSYDEGFVSEHETVRFVRFEKAGVDWFDRIINQFTQFSGLKLVNTFENNYFIYDYGNSYKVEVLINGSFRRQVDKDYIITYSNIDITAEEKNYKYANTDKPYDEVYGLYYGPYTERINISPESVLKVSGFNGKEEYYINEGTYLKFSVANNNHNYITLQVEYVKPPEGSDLLYSLKVTRGELVEPGANPGLYRSISIDYSNNHGRLYGEFAVSLIDPNGEIIKNQEFFNYEALRWR